MLHRTAAARGDDDIELAVFRFTLGIPGFDDALIPRVVGFLGSSLILINHILSPQPVSAPQTRTEAVGIFLSAIAIAAPTLQKRLEELQPNKGRKAPASSVEGASNVFAIDKSISEHIQQELAWSSFALLKNANICGMVIVWQGQALLCRGYLNSSLLLQQQQNDNTTTTNGDDSENNASNNNNNNNNNNDSVLQAVSIACQNFKHDSKEQYYENRGQITRSLEQCSGILPLGAQSVYILPLDNNNSNDSNDTSWMMLVSERERSLSRKERLWAQGIASKLSTTLIVSSLS